MEVERASEDARVSLFTELAKGQEIRSIEGFLTTAFWRKLCDEVRARYRYQRLLGDLAKTPVGYGPIEMLSPLEKVFLKKSCREKRDRLARELRVLTAARRNAFYWRCLHGREIKDVAKKLYGNRNSGSSDAGKQEREEWLATAINATRQHITRAQQDLHKALGDDLSIVLAAYHVTKPERKRS